MEEENQGYAIAEPLFWQRSLPGVYTKGIIRRNILSSNSCNADVRHVVSGYKQLPLWSIINVPNHQKHQIGVDARTGHYK